MVSCSWVRMEERKRRASPRTEIVVPRPESPRTCRRGLSAGAGKGEAAVELLPSRFSSDTFRRRKAKEDARVCEEAPSRVLQTPSLQHAKCARSGTSI